MKTILLQENAVNGVTQALNAVELSDPKAADELLPLVYQELRRLAAHRMANEAPGQTLQPTALVHEVWLKLWDATSGQEMLTLKGPCGQPQMP